MGILVLLAVFTADAAGGSGAGFALVYAVFLAVMTWLWYASGARSQDAEFVASPAATCSAWRGRRGDRVSAFLPDGLRLVVWAGFCVAWLVGIALAGPRRRVGLTGACRQPTRWSSASGCSRSSSSARWSSASSTACPRADRDASTS